MFGSISTAIPNTIVTSSFTANEDCTIDVGASYTVRLNGQVTPARPIQMIAGDSIAVDVMSPAPNAHIFVPWTYDGVQSHFAVVSQQGDNNPTLDSRYRGKVWYELPVSNAHLASKIETNGIESVLVNNSNEGTPRVVDVANVLDVQNSRLLYYQPEFTNPRRRINLGAKPLGMTRMFNGASATWENYVLLEDGFIERIDYNWNKTRSIAPIADAKSIWSDGTTLYVGGVNYVKVLSDLFTVASTIAVSDDSINYGAALADTVMFSGSSGKIYRLTGNTATMVYQSTTVGAPTTFQNQIIFPLTEEYKLRVYSNTGVFVRDFNTPGKLPWSLSAHRDNAIVVAYADSNSVELFTTLVGSPTPTVKTFNYKVTFAMVVDGVVYAHHYLREYNLTVPPNPPVTGLNFVPWQAPVGVDTGSGEFVVSTPASNRPAASSPGSTLIINGVKNASIVNNANRVAVITRSEEGRKSVAVVVGNYAYDFKVFSEANPSFATQINIANQFVNSQVIFNISVPPKVVNAPIALSHGNLFLNNVAYNGFTPVNAGDSLRITINVPQGAQTYYSILSIADSQYALTINTAVTRNADTQRFQAYLQNDTKSTVIVDETGVYDFPNYSDASVSKDGSLLVFPTILTEGDVLEIDHTRMSSWWNDKRETILMGPSVNYKVTGITSVDDAPDPVDFGFIRLGIPDFPSEAENAVTISGLSDEFSVMILGQGLEFSVNGGPLTATPLVKNGDTVRVTYTVLNLWQNRYAQARLENGQNYDFGLIQIDPPLGINFDPAQETYQLNTMWVEHESSTAYLPDASTPKIQSYEVLTTDSASSLKVANYTAASTDASLAQFALAQQHLDSLAIVSEWQKNHIPVETDPPSGRWQESAPSLSTEKPVGLWQISSKTVSTPASPGSWEGSAGVKPFAMWLSEVFDPIQFSKAAKNTWDELSSDAFILFDTPEGFETAYGYSVEILKVEKEYYHLIEANQKIFVPFFSYGSPDVMRSKDPVWMRGGIDSVNLPNAPLASLFPDPDRRVVVLAKFANDDTPVEVALVPYFLGVSKSYYYQNTALAVTPAVYQTNAAVGNFVADKHIRNLTPLGGFNSLLEAEIAGTSPGLVVQSYQQPEGSFSYIVRRGTSLVCDIIPSSLSGKAWLIGGG